MIFIQRGYYDKYEERLGSLFDDMQNFKTLMSDHVGKTKELFLNDLKEYSSEIQKVILNFILKYYCRQYMNRSNKMQG